MTLSAPRDTEAKFVADSESHSYPMAANTVVQQGALVVYESNGTDGYAEPGKVSTILKALGRAEETVNNTGGAIAAKSVSVRTGIFKFDNSTSADLISSKHIGTNCYVVSDSQVAATNGSSTRSVAGVVESVDSDGVWVAIKPY